jgi:hypothetical protein
MKYAVKIMLSKDDWIFITKDTGSNCWDLQPETFDDIKDAERFAEIWRKKCKDSRYVRVVEYDGESV